MKRLSVHSASCSCTSCVYRSRSKQSSVQQLIQEGSRIDRLYYGKYLPLRERKLLEKLIKTRAVYDDVRTQLISTSGSSDQTKSDHKIKRRDDDSTEKSSAVLKLVDLVDRGHIGSPNASKLSSCCSCCSCSSLRKIKKHMEKHPARVHRHHVPHEDIAWYTAEAEKRGRRRRKRLSTKISSKMRTVRFKMKKISSEPCFCTLSLSSMAKKSSKAFIKKIRSKEMPSPDTQVEEVATLKRKPLKKKLISCSCKIAKLPIKSFKKIKNIRTSVAKSSGSEMTNQRPFRIKKDSLTLFREKLHKKRRYGNRDYDEDWENMQEGNVEETRPRKYYKRYYGTGGERRRISTSTHTRRVRQGEIRFQTPPTRPRPVTKSVSSMTTFSKTDARVKRPKSSKQKPHILKENIIQEKTYKSDRHAPKRTESEVFYEAEQASPEVKFDSVICECKPSTKSTSSMTTILKRRTLKSTSKSEMEMKKPKGRQHEKDLLQIQPKNLEIEVKRPVTSKTRPQIVVKETAIEENTGQQQSAPAQPKITTKIVRKVKTIKPKNKNQKTRYIIKETVIEETTTGEEKPTKEKSSKNKPEKTKVAKAPPKPKPVICECKPTTKTISSATSTKLTTIPRSKTKITDTVPRPPRPLQQEKVYKPSRHKYRKERYRYPQDENIEEPKKQAVKLSSSFRFEIEFSKKKYPKLTSKERIEHVEAKRAGRIKPTHGERRHHRRHHHSKIQVSGALPKAESSEESQISYLRESASQTSKALRQIVLPFPRECEPSMCIPYECDPENCARILLSRSKSPDRAPLECDLENCPRILLSRSKSPGRSAMTGTERLRRKSIGSATLTRRSSSRSRYIQSKSTESFISKPKKYLKEPSSQIVERDIVENVQSSHPDRQAVRISSNFSFNIEFYKDKKPSVETPRADFSSFKPQNKQKVQRIKHKDRGHRTRHTDSRNISSQSRSSQSYKNVQVGHRLKRCLCNLKLLQMKKHKVRHAVSKRTMVSFPTREYERAARIRQTQTKPIGIAYVVPPVSSLLPYECEPYFCTPGECNPYECAERILERNRKEARRYSKETNTASTTKMSFASQSLIKSTSRRIQSIERRQKVKHYTSKIIPKVSSAKSDKQAVRLGSNFSFNIEFSKTKSNQPNAKEKKNEFISYPPIKTERRRMHNKGIKVYKPRVRYAASEITQNVKTKHTYTKPFLERCFCTLKLSKKNKRKADTATPFRNEYIVHRQNKMITNRPNIHYHQVVTNYAQPKQSKLLPMNCPCPPSSYQYPNCVCDPASRSRLSETSTYSKSGNTQSYTKRPKEKVKKNKTNDRELIMPSQSKQQIVRIGSSFNFNIEFNKEKHPPNIDRYDVVATERQEVIMKQLKSRGVNEETKHLEKGMNVGSMIKKCFCTLKLKKGNNTKVQDKSKIINPKICDCKSTSTKTSHVSPSPQICECKSTSTKTSHKIQSPKICVCKSTSTKTSYLLPQICDCKSTSTKMSKPIYDVQSQKCAPDSCMPRICDPFECYEEVKRRGNKRSHDRRISPDGYKRTSIMSMRTSEFSGNSKLTNAQSTRQAVHLGSNFNFNIEFSKNHIVSPVYHTTSISKLVKYNPSSGTSTAKRMKNQATIDKRGLQNRLSQANKLRKDDKASNVGFSLKRCFCTLGLQKKYIIPKACTCPPDHKVYGYQPITAQFVKVIHGIKNKDLTKFYKPVTVKSKCKTYYKHLHGRKSSKLLDNGYLDRKNNFKGKQNCRKRISTASLTTSSSATETAQSNPRIDLNITEYQDTNINRFYRSYFALNVNVSKNKNYKALEDNECEPGFCVPYECDPVECLKRINKRLKRSQLSGTDRPETKSVASYKQTKFGGRKQAAGRNKDPLHVGSDLSIVMGVFKDTDPYNNKITKIKGRKGKSVERSHPSRQAIQLGSDVSIKLGFYKEKVPQKSKHAKDAGTHFFKRQLHDTDSQVNIETQNKGTGISNLLRCFCTLKKEPGAQKVSKTTTSKETAEPVKTKKQKGKNDKNKNKKGKKEVEIKTKDDKKQSKKEKKQMTKDAKDNKKDEKKTSKKEKNTMEKVEIKKGKKEKNTMDIDVKKKNKKQKGKKENDKGTMAQPDIQPDEKAKKKVKLEVYECTPKVCGSAKCDSRKCRDVQLKRLKTNREYGGGPNYPKHKSTSSLTKAKRSNFDSKPIQYKNQEFSNSSFPGKKKKNKKYKRPFDTNTVSFGSNIRFNMEFFRDNRYSTGDNQKKPKDNINYGQSPGVDPRKCVCFADQPIEAKNKPNKAKNQPTEAKNQPTKDKNKPTKAKNQPLEAKKMKTKDENNKNKKGAKTVKLGPDECEPHTCTPGKCAPVECEKRIKKRSKNTKVKKEKYTTSVKSSEINRDITKQRSGPKSFNECHPRDCEEKLRALGLIGPSKSPKYSNKQASLPKQKFKNIPTKGDKLNPSMLKRCMCVLKLRKLKQPRQVTQCDAGTSMKNKKDFNKFIQKCFCNLKGGKAKIVDIKKKDGKPPKQGIKLEKKPNKAVREMETILPYCKKKFNKLESRTKLTHGSTNTSDISSCTCPHTKITEKTTKDKKPPKGKIKDDQVMTFCPICKNITNATPGKHEDNKVIVCGGTKTNKQLRKAEKKARKREAKKRKQHTCACPVCPNCKRAKSDEKTEPCPCCKPGAIILTKDNWKSVAKTIYSSAVSSICSKLSNKYSGLSNKVLGKNKKPKEPKEPTPRTKPFFEMLVNENNMHIVNREEVMRKLGSTGKDTRVMKEARKANIKGEIPPPIMEVRIDRKNANIVNSDELLRRMNSTNKYKTKSGKKELKSKSFPSENTPKKPPVAGSKSEGKAKKPHGSKCKCCECTRKRAKPRYGGAVIPTGPRRKLKPCVCGSVVCKKDWDKLKREERSLKSMKQLKPCVCGSNVCREESQKIPEMLLDAARQAQLDKEKIKQDIIKEKLYQKARLQRKKIYAARDKELWKKRKKEDRREMKLVKKYDTAPDLLMITESLLDLGRFGSKAFCDVMRSAGRVARHPRDGVYHVKDAMNYPGYAAKHIRESFKGMGFFSTMARIKRRMQKAPVTKSAITKLESHPLTNYLIHIHDKNPKHRMKKFKQKRLREPLDFECSLFMASLRKRPCLRVYYMCPWFYPHCVGLLGIWKQFTDILLFILAVGVWSPCILAMELCRAMMCCCLCTG